MLSAALLTGGIDEIFSRSTGAVTQTFLVDALGSTVRLTDSAGAKDTDYTYEAYGKASLFVRTLARHPQRGDHHLHL